MKEPKKLKKVDMMHYIWIQGFDNIQELELKYKTLIPSDILYSGLTSDLTSSIVKPWIKEEIRRKPSDCIDVAWWEISTIYTTINGHYGFGNPMGVIKAECSETFCIVFNK